MRCPCHHWHLMVIFWCGFFRCGTKVSAMNEAVMLKVPLYVILPTARKLMPVNTLQLKYWCTNTGDKNWLFFLGSPGVHEKIKNVTKCKKDSQITGFSSIYIITRTKHRTGIKGVSHHIKLMLMPCTTCIYKSGDKIKRRCNLLDRRI